MKSVSVIGGGLAGCEAAYVIAESGIHVNLFEMKPGKHSPAHKTDDPVSYTHLTLPTNSRV